MKLLPIGMRKALDRVRRRLFPYPVILRYHRIADPLLDPFALCVSPDNFTKHLALIKRHAVPMQLRELVRLLRQGAYPRRAVVVTFDDGYVDNLFHAKPLLELHGVPATLFVTTAYTRSQREFWSDALEQLLLSAGSLPRTFHVERHGIDLRWELGEAAHYSPADCHRDRTWNVRAANDPTSRHTLFRMLHDALKPLTHDQRSELIDAIQSWAKVQVVVRNSHRPLSSAELSQVAGGHLVEIGAHSETHPVLSGLSRADQQAEIVGSKTYLEAVLGSLVTSFSYPYGHPCDYTGETADLLRKAGFDCACSTIPARIKREPDLFQLPRVYVGDWDAETFRRQCLHRSENGNS